jgi:hypothetical protein
MTFGMDLAPELGDDVIVRVAREAAALIEEESARRG